MFVLSKGKLAVRLVRVFTVYRGVIHAAATPGAVTAITTAARRVQRPLFSPKGRRAVAPGRVRAEWFAVAQDLRLSVLAKGKPVAVALPARQAKPVVPVRTAPNTASTLVRAAAATPHVAQVRPAARVRVAPRPAARPEQSAYRDAARHRPTNPEATLGHDL